MKIKQTVFVISICLCSTGVVAANLSVEVTNIAKPQGKVFIKLFNSEASFLQTHSKIASINTVGSSVRVTFSDIAPGEYAVSTFQDIDGDGELGRNFIGKPKEPNGVSNNAVGSYGPPKFSDAKFKVAETDLSVSIVLHD